MQYVNRDTPYFRQSNAEEIAQVMNLDEFNERRKLTVRRKEVERLELAQKHRVCAEDMLGPMLKAIAETTEKSGTFDGTKYARLLNFPSCKPFITTNSDGDTALETGVVEQVREGLQKRRIPVQVWQDWAHSPPRYVLRWEMK